VVSAVGRPGSLVVRRRPIGEESHVTDTLKVQLEALYRAGKISLPERADQLTHALETIAEVRAAWEGPTMRAANPVPLVTAMAMNETVFHLLRRAVLSWQDAAHALVAIADDVAATDAEAAALVRSTSFELDDLPMPQLRRPPTLDEASA
jgi:hypothetical protein